MSGGAARSRRSRSAGRWTGRAAATREVGAAANRRSRHEAGTAPPVARPVPGVPSDRGRKALGGHGRARNADAAMLETATHEVRSMREPAVLEPEADAEVAGVPAIAKPGLPGEWRGRRLVLATTISVAAAMLATVLALA